MRKRVLHDTPDANETFGHEISRLYLGDRHLLAESLKLGCCYSIVPRVYFIEINNYNEIWIFLQGVEDVRIVGKKDENNYELGGA